MAVHSMFPICKRARLNDLVFFAAFCILVVPHFCQKFCTIENHTQSLNHYVAAKFAPCSSFLVWNLPLWDLDLLPLMFLPVWSVLVLAKFLLSGRQAGTQVPHRRLSLWGGLDLVSSHQPTLQQAKGSQRHKRLITTKRHNIQLEHWREERNIQNIFMKVPNIWDPRHISNMLRLIWDFL